MTGRPSSGKRGPHGVFTRAGCKLNRDTTESTAGSVALAVDEAAAQGNSACRSAVSSASSSKGFRRVGQAVLLCVL